MPKVKITPNSAYDPLGVRILLSNLGVKGPMLQDETSITCVMTEAEINSFRNGRGAAHGIQIIPDAPPIPAVETDDEPAAEDPVSLTESSTTPILDMPAYPRTYGKLGRHRITVYNREEEKAAKESGYIHVTPDPLNAA